MYVTSKKIDLLSLLYQSCDRWFNRLITVHLRELYAYTLIIRRFTAGIVVKLHGCRFNSGKNCGVAVDGCFSDEGGRPTIEILLRL